MLLKEISRAIAMNREEIEKIDDMEMTPEIERELQCILNNQEARFEIDLRKQAQRLRIDLTFNISDEKEEGKNEKETPRNDLIDECTKKYSPRTAGLTEFDSRSRRKGLFDAIKSTAKDILKKEKEFQDQIVMAGTYKPVIDEKQIQKRHLAVLSRDTMEHRDGYQWFCPTCRNEITGYPPETCKVCGQKLRYEEDRRLIDAASLKSRVAENVLNADECARFYKAIDEEPTAYDEDQVVQQLKDRSTLARPVGWPKSYEIVTLQDAVEIVEGGGTDAERE